MQFFDANNNLYYQLAVFHKLLTAGHSHIITPRKIYTVLVRQITLLVLTMDWEGHQRNEMLTPLSGRHSALLTPHFCKQSFDSLTIHSRVLRRFCQ